MQDEYFLREKCLNGGRNQEERTVEFAKTKQNCYTFPYIPEVSRAQQALISRNTVSQPVLASGCKDYSKGGA
jgi:hypothetical protein